MPQPLSSFPAAKSFWYEIDALADKPDMAVLVTNILAASAAIDFELSLLLVRILGADEKPALAIFSILETQRLQRKGLVAAARAAFEEEADFEIFTAVIDAAESAQAERNLLAHGIWCKCSELPDALLIAESKHLKSAEHAWEKFKGISGEVPMDEYKPIMNLFSNVFVYRKGDLERALRDLKECVQILLDFRNYIQPLATDKYITAIGLAEDAKGTRGGALRSLNASRLFRQALTRVQDKAKGDSSPPAQPESPEQSHS